MPATSGPPAGSGASNSGGGTSQRTTFRPPWVKDGPPALPMPSQPWTPVRRDSDTGRSQQPNVPFGPGMLRKVSQPQASQDGASASANPPADPKANLRKTSKITIVPSQPQQPPEPQLQQVSQPQAQVNAAPQNNKSREVKVPITRQPAENGQPSAAQKRPPPPRMESVDKSRNQQPPSANKPSIPPPPPAPPAPPPPPPPPPGMPGLEPPIERKQLTSKQKSKLDALRNRPRRRPDYGSLMKEIEGGAKLKRVQCNDRSSPLLPKVKVKEQFLYESESPNVHNQLLKQIETGVKLKKVKTNDRSKPVLDGLRKFRRQMTIEEQMQKAEKEEPLEAEPLDDLDDIDRVRDDLQSTKQMLALELRNKEALERDNKRLLSRLANLEAELESAKKAPAVAAAPGAAPTAAPDDKLVKQLKAESESQQKVAKDMEKRYHTTAEELDTTKAKLEEAVLQKKQMEKQLRELEDGLLAGKIIRQPSKRLISSKSGDIKKQASSAKLGQNAAAGNVAEDSSSEYTEETITESEDEDDEDDGDDAAAQERRVARELKLLSTKLRALKDKEQLARNEKRALRYQERNQQKALRAEKKKYKALQKEVDKMAKLMKEDEDDEEEDEEKEESESSEEETESESSDESSEEEPPSGDDLPEEAPPEDKKKNLTERSKRHENILSALKKNNYLLKANIDRLKDDLNKHREMSLTLQEDLNSVLAELG